MSEQPHDTEPVTIVLATRNQGKVRELAEPLRAFGLRVVGLDAFPDLPRGGASSWSAPSKDAAKKTPCSRPAKFPSAPALSPLPTIPGSKWMPSTALKPSVCPETPPPIKQERNDDGDIAGSAECMAPPAGLVAQSTMRLLANTLSSVRLWNRSAASGCIVARLYARGH